MTRLLDGKVFVLGQFMRKEWDVIYLRERKDNMLTISNVCLPFQASILIFSPCFSNLILQFQLAPQEFVKGLCWSPHTFEFWVASTSWPPIWFQKLFCPQGWPCFAVCQQHCPVASHLHKYALFKCSLCMFAQNHWSISYRDHVAQLQLVGGNSALALALTVLSNLLGTIAVSLKRDHTIISDKKFL